MGKNLPYLKSDPGLYETTSAAFYGIDRAEGINDGAISDTLNMTSDFFPAIGTRRARPSYDLADGKTLLGAGFSGGKSFYCAKEQDSLTAYFYYNGERKFEVTSDEKTFVKINSYICVFPDKKYYNEKESESKGSYESITALHEAFMTSSTVKDGDIYKVGESLFSYNSSGLWHDMAENQDNNEYYNVQNEWIYISEISGSLETDSSFGYKESGEFQISKSSSESGYDTVESWSDKINSVKEGDAVKLIATYKKPDSAATFTRKSFYAKVTSIKAMSTGAEYYFSGLDIPIYVDADGNAISVPSGAKGTLSSMRIKKEVPDFDVVFCHKNRIWGSESGKIYASALGDPTSFSDFSASASGAWVWDSGYSDGFTGGCSFSGYPTFFGEDRIIKIGGDYPAEYATYETQNVSGVKGGCQKSLAVLGNYLYYVSPEGVCRYSGSFPVVISLKLGEEAKNFFSASAGAGGGKYYLSSGGKTFVYDPVRDIWLIEDRDKSFCAFITDESRLMGVSENKLYHINGEDKTAFAQKVPSYVEFSPFFDSSTAKKGLSKVYINLEAKGTVRLYISYDGKEFSKVWEKTLAERRTYNIPIRIKRCDMYALKIESDDRMKIYAVTRKRYIGSRRRDHED